MRVIFFVLALFLRVSTTSAQTSVKVVHEYYDSVYEKFNADVVRVLHLVKGKASPQTFSYKIPANGHKLTIDYHLYEDTRIISVQITGQTKDVVKVYTSLYNKNAKKRSFIKNDEWVRLQTDNKTYTSKIIIQAIIY